MEELPISSRATVQCNICATFFNITLMEHLYFGEDAKICHACQRKIDEGNKKFLDRITKKR